MKLCPDCDRHLFGSEPACPFCGAAQVTAPARAPAGPLAAITLALTLGTVACGPAVEPGQSESSSGGTADESGPPISTTTAASTGVTTVELTTDGGTVMTTIDASSSDDNDDSSCAFYAGCPPDVNTSVIECDVLAQDCPEGEKCMPWANDGGMQQNAARCSPVAPDPGAAGDPCTVEGGPFSGIDSCDVGIICYDVDPRTNEGTCVPMCVSGDLGATCSDAEQLCVVLSDVLMVCRDECDPLAPACPDGMGCYPGQPDEGFVCWPPSDGAGAQGDACTFYNDCMPGTLCVEGPVLLDCAAAGCCTEYCDVTSGVPCPGADQGVECVPWYEPGTAPAGYEDAGVCGLPP